ncbi:hypothetical protein HOK51_07165 [Candidatus Woesearchaeota archaeon]|jgi:hypothetical protein|nr:hypothetical protein [Candidatus Woesearchaeota archaeon]MBT6519601.1 hypothetical protein [Candidatus Woesearchaeota archaeon]MBT7367516.1 hypothetical protein [Candidatus Woesearchaeota archaeon]
MFKRFINRNEKKLGPYYYHNFKTKDGKVKSIYLGKEKKKATKKLLQLQEYLQLRKKEAKETKKPEKISLLEIHNLIDELDQLNAELKKK